MTVNARGDAGTRDATVGAYPTGRVPTGGRFQWGGYSADSTRVEHVPSGFITLAREMNRPSSETADRFSDTNTDVPSVKPAKRIKPRRRMTGEARRMRSGKHQYSRTYYIPKGMKRWWIAAFVGGMLIAGSTGAIGGMWLAGVYE